MEVPTVPPKTDVAVRLTGVHELGAGPKLNFVLRTPLRLMARTSRKGRTRSSQGGETVCFL